MHTPTRRLSPFSALQRVIFLTARKKDELEIIRKCICSANRLSYQRFTKEFSLLLRGDGFCALAREVPERCMIQRESVKKLGDLREGSNEWAKFYDGNIREPGYESSARKNNFFLVTTSF